MGDKIQHALAAGDRFCDVCGTVDVELRKLADDCDWHASAQGGTKVGLGGVGIVSGALFMAAPFTAGSTALIGGIVLAGAGAVGGVTHAATSYAVNNGNQNALVEHSGAFEKAAKDYRLARERAGDAKLDLDKEALARFGFGAVSATVAAASGLSVAKDASVLALNGGKFPIGSAAMTTNELIQAFQTSGQVGAQVAGAARAGGSIASASTGATSVGVNTIGTVGGSASKSIGLGGEAANFAGSAGEAVAGAGMSTTTKVLGVAGGALGVGIGIFDVVTGVTQLACEDATSEKCRELARQVRDARSSVRKDQAQLRQVLSLQRK